MATFSSVAAFNAATQRKGLAGVVLAAPYATAALTDIATTGARLRRSPDTPLWGS
jgi:hypothetical protein